MPNQPPDSKETNPDGQASHTLAPHDSEHEEAAGIHSQRYSALVVIRAVLLTSVA